MATSRSVEDRVTRAAEDTLTEQHYVTAIDVLLRLGWLAHRMWTCGDRAAWSAWRRWCRPVRRSS